MGQQVWVTKYALTRGVYECIGEQPRDAGHERKAVDWERAKGTIAVYSTRGMHREFFGTGDWHMTKRDAMAKANHMRDLKIEQHERAVRKLRSSTILTIKGPTL